MLRHYALKLEPDLFILSFGANDGRYVLQPADTVLAVDETALGAMRWTMLKLKTVQLLRSWIFSVYDPFKTAVPPEGQPRPSRFPSVPLDQFRENLQTMISRGQEDRRRHGPHVALLPDDYAGATREVAGSEKLPYRRRQGHLPRRACPDKIREGASIHRRPPTCARSTEMPRWPGINGFM